MDKNITDKKEIGKRLKESREYLNLSRPQFASRMKINASQLKYREEGITKLSEHEAIFIENEFHISSNWLLTGQGEMMAGIYAVNDNTANLVQEALAPYSTTKISPSEPSPDIQDALKYAIMAFKILTSGTGYASALRENITWFDEAVDDKKRIQKLENDMESLKEQLLASGTLSSK